MKLNKILLGVAISTAASLALAAWSIDDDGFGFVGKGDVQTAFNWNNKALQQNASGVTFTYENVTKYLVVCEWSTGPDDKTHHTVSHKKKASIESSVAHLSRTNSNGKDGEITGFYLNGFSNLTEDGDIPEVGDPCPGNEGNGKKVLTVEPVGEATGGLYVNHGTKSVLLP
jgi:hypothetical protein